MVRFTEENYDTKKCVRIVNPKQCAAYMRHGVNPIDIYANNDTMVFIFLRDETKELFQRWIDHTL